MKKGTARRGSILMMLLVISALIMAVATVTLRSGTLFYELALHRAAHLAQLCAAQALVYYGIAYSKTMQGNPPHRSLSFAHWPLSDSSYEGTILIEPSQKRCLIQATLSNQGQELCVMQAEIARQKGCWRIISWRD